MTRCLGGSTSSITPHTASLPSGSVMRHGSPAANVLSIAVRWKYCRVNAGSVSACHTSSAVARMWIW